MNTILPNIKTGKKQHPMTQKRIAQLIDQLADTHMIPVDDLRYLLDHICVEDTSYLFDTAHKVKQPYYQNRVFLRGLIEISNYCSKGCHYCGINRTNKNVQRYRLDKETILECCRRGYDLGYKTFVLQAGEDPALTDEFLCEVIKSIKTTYPDSRISLSLGERSFASYIALYQAGADRYLLRHETASKRLYEHLHPNDSSFENRRQCLDNLKVIGYQTGSGCMVGSPSQTNDDIVQDLLYLHQLQPHMVGVGPYLCHEDTLLRGNQSGTLLETYIILALVRLILPQAMLPATTALGTLDKLGRENALFVGANVMMPNIGPKEYLEAYQIYQNKQLAKDTDESNRDNTKKRIEAFGHIADFSVGDVHTWEG
ncbi:[FeFe] hydrogenase H-cluster radical SAM maturase HydE [Candidatus Xianfuyuplasma coldseepsis]|uniref:[FeFe] hydrogenase H-cluster radical SAM maturase HydE n=1 Tax=Candidatus Xianfuyuplasma coldseepsis TaxID=2782163 RepID=A0A7L7KTS1_9MOLU|nr:[FeFe] hydrogenase H-cluster radical SAM maturase HydE [Xianfuyuplasma coldseepsis]QMS85394.1 [FeFe] hydrogenase H-cluster radical SAM maturase HydE [Xianfuyuplasma coldseepsis]